MIPLKKMMPPKNISLTNVFNDLEVFPPDYSSIELSAEQSNILAKHNQNPLKDTKKIVNDLGKDLKKLE
ncbi:8741_t:CDS:2 [Scutellospora calospora]|uniref:8741_t:CDS:1 n=1 Tax=Scutellospora calospora TaxID=85575 RepID=A0ACA9JTY7_9GLOM|nr:8741_t:CDS:2 [Scutellospora calospora]